MNREESVFPFAAVVGQEQVKTALLLNAVSPQVGGVLIRGSRGTAKSTLARALAGLLPEIEVVCDCPFSCDPNDIEALCGYCAGRLAVEGTLPSRSMKMKIVTLPLNATEEMVVGTLDIEKALRRGEKSFEPGILARANRSILYVDEVNLLEDHIVDILLDSAAMGVNVVEREGISFRHGAHFILIGTMNPEEGDLRPQLEDRFGLCAEVDTEVGRENRAEILRRNLSFGRNPLEFESLWNNEQEKLREKVRAARGLYPSVEVDDVLLDAVAFIVDRAGADGHRADLAMLNASRSLAATEGRCAVDTEDLARVAPLALNHRVRKGPLGLDGTSRVDVPGLMEVLTSESQETLPGMDAGNERSVESPPSTEDAPAAVGELASGPAAAEFEGVRIPDAREPGVSLPGRGGTSRRVDDSRGRFYRIANPPANGRVSASDVALDATIRATASRAGASGEPEIAPEDIRVKVRKRKVGSSILFVVDASASMGAKRRLEASREAMLSLLVEAYQKRDRVGLVVFKDDDAQLVMSPTSSAALAGRLLAELSPGGTTPLSHGLALACRVMDRELARSPRPRGVLVLISDGGGNVTMGSSDPLKEALGIAKEIRGRGVSSLVLDSAPRPAGSPLAALPTPAKRIADALAGSYHAARNMSSEVILDGVTKVAAREEMKAAGRA